MKRKSVIMLVILVFAAFGAVSAQSVSTDPAIAKARAEMEVANDLGRLLGYIHQMATDEARLALSSQQLRDLNSLVDQVLNTRRLDKATAEAFLLQLEDDILTPAQLMYTDKLFAARESTRSGTPGSGTGTGSSNRSAEAGSEGGLVTAYLNGGDYNPLKDSTKSLGEGVQNLRNYLKSRL
ncbi:MAG: hypothetical protein KKI09_02385 [Spirochaetes bacterium]|nr:hypothetical protein [Spirochaetota bacterium]MBU0954253.1 hypothetical protein [Spirochaetota bacterium]